MNGITPPLTKRGQATFIKLCRAAEMLFHNKSYHLTTIADIASKARVAVGTFYLYFEDKYAIYKYLLLQYSHEIRSSIAIAIKDIDNRREQERVGIRTFIKFVRDKPQSYTIIWQSLQVDKTLFIDYYQNFALSYVKGLRESQEQIKTHDYQTIAYALMGISNFVGLQVIMFEKGLSDDEKIEDIVNSVIEVLDFGLFK